MLGPGPSILPSYNACSGAGPNGYPQVAALLWALEVALWTSATVSSHHWLSLDHPPPPSFPFALYTQPCLPSMELHKSLPTTHETW